jgi:hypothetical protein
MPGEWRPALRIITASIIQNSAVIAPPRARRPQTLTAATF